MPALRLPWCPLFKCKECEHQFSVTSGTIFANRKLPLRTILMAAATFVNGAKGHAALQLSRDLDVQYKSAFVLQHKLRDVVRGPDMAAEIAAVDLYLALDGSSGVLSRHVAVHQTGKRRVVVVAREKEGKTLPFVLRSELEAVETLCERIEAGSTVHADEATHWDALHSRYLTNRINHQEAYSADGACTNMAESFFSRLRRAEIGIHHRIAGPYLAAYASEMAWREDNRRRSNGEQY